MSKKLDQLMETLANAKKQRTNLGIKVGEVWG
jgi:hypothetical protein